MPVAAVKISPDLRQIQRQHAGRVGAVDGRQDAALAGQFADSRRRHHQADLRRHMAEKKQCRLGADGFLDGIDYRIFVVLLIRQRDRADAQTHLLG